MSIVRGINQIQEARKERDKLLLDLGIDIVWSDNPIFTPSKHNSKNKSELWGILNDLKATLRIASVELCEVINHEPSIPSSMGFSVSCIDELSEEHIKGTARELHIKTERLSRQLFIMGGDTGISPSLAWYGN